MVCRSLKVVSLFLVALIAFLGFSSSSLKFNLLASEENIRIIGGGLQKGVFFGPTYLNVEQQRVYISDTLNNRVQAFIRGNVFQLAFGGFGQNEREFDGVGGICSTNGNVYVVDSGNARVQIFDTKATYLGQFGGFGESDGLFRFPTDIATDGKKFFIADTGNNRIQIFDLSGKFIKSFGKKGSGNGEFSEPFGIEVFQGKIFVSDTGNNRIQIFDESGNFISSFGWEGTGEKALKSPKGITIYNNEVYIADSANKRIQVFSITGIFKRVITDERLLNPYGVAVLDEKLLVSDFATGRILSFELNGKFYDFFGSSPSINGRFVKPIAVTASNKNIFVLDELLKCVQVFDENGKFVRIIRGDSIDAGFVKPSGISYYDKKLYVVDTDASKVFIFTEDGEYINSFGKYGSNDGELIFPEDISVYEEKIYITDAGNSRVQIFDLKGKYLAKFGTFGFKDGQFYLADGISVFNSKIYVSDLGNSRIQIFDLNGNFLDKFGKKGSEIGSFYGPTGLYVDLSGKVYVADTLNNRIQIVDTLTNKSNVYGSFGSIFHIESNIARGDVDFDYSLLPGNFLYPTDVACFKDYIVVVDSYNLRVQLIPFSNVFGANTLRLTPYYLDFGSISKGSSLERSFFVNNEGGNILTGSITSNHPAIKVEPENFSAANQEVKVKITTDSLEDGKNYNAKVTVKLDSGQTKDVDIIFKVDSNPDFYTEIPPIFVASADEDFGIPIKIVPQNGFTGIVTFVALGLPKNTTPTFLPASVNLPENDTVLLKLKPSSKYVEAGIYDIEIQASAARGNNVHRASSVFVYKQKLELVPHTVLGELFTAIWCQNCPFSHRAMDRLYEELGKERVVFIEYYVDSTADHPSPRLSWVESEQRLKWYQSDQGLPTIYFDGTDYIKGVPTGLADDSDAGKEKAMYDGYSKKIQEKLKEPSLVNISVRSSFDSAVRVGRASATITALDNIPYKDPRVYFALTESNIPYVAINKDTIHHFVLRDFITPKNDDLNDYLGTPMKLSTGETFGKKGDIFDISVEFKLLDIYNLSNVSLIVFVQDNVTKKVLQTMECPVKVVNLKDFEFISDGSLSQNRTKGEEAVITTYVINNGTMDDFFNVSVLNKSKDKWVYKVLVDGKEFTPGENDGLRISALKYNKLEIRVNVPQNAQVNATQDFVINVSSKSNGNTKTLKAHIDVIESRPPDFKFSIATQTEEFEVMAGELLTVEFNVVPDPYFEEEIALKILNPPEELESYSFNPNKAKAPFSSKLELTFKSDTPDKNFSLEVLAEGGKVKHSEIILIKVLRNPDAVPPILDLSFPPENYLTNKPEIVISGITDAQAKLYINGEEVLIESNGSFSFNFKLNEGENIINVVSRNRKGLETEITRVVTLDTIPPILEIDELPGEVYKNKIVITGRTEPDAIVRIGQLDAKVNSSGEFSEEITLEKGSNFIEVIAIDKASNETKVELVINFVTLIKLKIGSNVVYINDEEERIEAPPYIKNGRTMVPLRVISEALDATVRWNPTNKEITIEKDMKIIRMRIGSKDVFIKEFGQTGEERYELEAPPEIVNGRTFVPVRFIAEQFGAKVNWNQETKEIIIKS
jgi:thiol-disulfide isomerase/thioredoxin